MLCKGLHPWNSWLNVINPHDDVAVNKLSNRQISYQQIKVGNER